MVNTICQKLGNEILRRENAHKLGKKSVQNSGLDPPDSDKL